LLVTKLPAAVGAATATVGSSESRVTDTVADVRLPAASCATTVNTFTPACSAAAAMLHEVVPAARPLAPRLFVHVTSVTPRSSLAVPDRVAVSALVTRFAAGAVIAMVGALPSDVIEIRSVEVLPAASLAVTVMTFTPGSSGSAATDHAVVPAATPEPPRSFAHRTSVTPNRSDAVPASAAVAAVVVCLSALVGAV